MPTGGPRRESNSENGVGAMGARLWFLYMQQVEDGGDVRGDRVCIEVCVREDANGLVNPRILVSEDVGGK